MILPVEGAVESCKPALPKAFLGAKRLSLISTKQKMSQHFNKRGNRNQEELDFYFIAATSARDISARGDSSL